MYKKLDVVEILIDKPLWKFLFCLKMMLKCILYVEYIFNSFEKSAPLLMLNSEYTMVQ